VAGTAAKTVESDVDLEAVKNIFDLLLTASLESESGLQIVVLEHANLPEEKYQRAMVEERDDMLCFRKTGNDACIWSVPHGLPYRLREQICLSVPCVPMG
jgi:hypothetical protein